MNNKVKSMRQQKNTKKPDYKYLLMFAKVPRHKAAIQREMDACEE
jgi:hypothetical protein